MISHGRSPRRFCRKVALVLSGVDDGGSAFASLRLLQAMASGELPSSPWPGMRRKMQDETPRKASLPMGCFQKWGYPKMMGL